MAQAILQIRSYARLLPERPALVAVVGAPRVPEKVAKAVLQFARDHAPDVGAGVVDLEGSRFFSGPNLEALKAALPPAKPVHQVEDQAVHLFSDLNQWMLKLLLARHINRPELLGGPIGSYRNASELAHSAKVSVMSAFRFLRQLEHEGFLHESSEVLQLVRLEELLRRWQAVYLRPIRELPVRWLLPGDPRRQLQRALDAYGGRACLGLFAAARALDFGHVKGVPAHVYVDSLHRDRAAKMAVVDAAVGQVPDLVLRVPVARESVFRGRVKAEGYWAADIIQVWLDVSGHPSRGKEQADFIYRRVFDPIIESV